MNPTRTLPVFRYHPDPVATGSIIPTDDACECCQQCTGWMAKSRLYCEDEIETICPWCIADGSAAAKYDGQFVDSDPLLSAGLDDAIVEEVSKRTPGYESWQQESWIACCDDACEFHGDASRESLLAMNQSEMTRLAEEMEFPPHVLKDILDSYSPGSSPAFYRFVCRHCKQVHHYADFA